MKTYLHYRTGRENIPPSKVKNVPVRFLRQLGRGANSNNHHKQQTEADSLLNRAEGGLRPKMATANPRSSPLWLGCLARPAHLCT
eukprot:scaffold20452_cov36-Cyclotella_meneghiniana.AAC.1